MKITAGKTEGFLNNPPESVRLFLFFGPDQGLVYERGKKIITHYLDDPNDPFNKVVLPATELKGDPARLGDEVAALSFTGGRRVIRIQDATDSITSIFKTYLSDPVGNGIVILEAGELSPRSTLRKLFESDKNLCAAVACYGDEGRTLSDVIQDSLKSQGKSIEREAIGYLLAHLGSDRQVSRGELEKLILYMGDETQVNITHAQAAIGDNAAFSLEHVIDACASGDFVSLESKLMRCYAEGNAPIMILRALCRHFHKLHLIKTHMEQGQNLEQAIGKIKPPVIFKQVPAIKRQASLWTTGKLHQALDILMETEGQCKTSNFPAETVCSRALLRISQAARKKSG